MYSYLLKKEIKEQTIVPCYFFWGEETFLAFQFIQELRESLNLPEDQEHNVERFNLEDQSWMDIIDLARTIPFFISSWRIMVVEIPMDKGSNLTSTEDKILNDYFSSPPATQTIILIILPGKIRKNSPLLKLFSSFPTSSVCMKELRPLKGNNLYTWIDKKLGQSAKVATADAKRRLIELTGNDLRKLDNEIDKIITYIDGKREIKLDDINQVSGWIKSFMEWEIVDSLTDARYEQCLVALNNLLKKKESVAPLKIFGLITKFFRDLLLAKLWLREEDKTRKEIFRELKPQIQEKFGDFYTRKFKQFYSLVDGISMQDLNRFLKQLEVVDLMFKTTDLSLQTLLEGFLFGYCEHRMGRGSSLKKTGFL